MIQRKYWKELVEKAWQSRPVIWLAGVRRVGKTYLSQSLNNVEYFDCELPRVRQLREVPRYPGWAKNEPLVDAHGFVRSGGLWRDKQKHEIDFVWAPRGRVPLAIECKWSANQFDPGAMRVFRRQYPKGDNVVVAHDVERSFKRTYDDLVIHFEGLRGLVCRLTS